jgi:signal recognition particle subunit SRP54
VNEVNRLLEQFREMQKMMKKMGGMQGGGKGGMPRLPFGGGGMFGMR